MQLPQQYPISSLTHLQQAMNLHMQKLSNLLHAVKQLVEQLLQVFPILQTLSHIYLILQVLGKAQLLILPTSTPSP